MGGGGGGGVSKSLEKDGGCDGGMVGWDHWDVMG